MDKKLAIYLKDHAVSYVLYRHKAVYTVAESSTDSDIIRIPGLRCKTLFLKDTHDRFYLVGLPGDKRLDFKKLEHALHVKKLTMGSPEELLTHAGLVPGSVSIFGAALHPEIHLVIDTAVWGATEVCFHPNINTETLVLTHQALERYYTSLINAKTIVDL